MGTRQPERVLGLGAVGAVGAEVALAGDHARPREAGAAGAAVPPPPAERVGRVGREAARAWGSRGVEAATGGVPRGAHGPVSQSPHPREVIL